MYIKNWWLMKVTFFVNWFHAQNQAILDPNTSVTMAYEILENLLSKMKELQERAALFKSYQKALKVIIS